jgi:WD40 repeat protein
MTTTIQVTFQLQPVPADASGEVAVGVVGAHAQLGGWSPSNRLLLVRDAASNSLRATVHLDRGAPLEYKYVIFRSNGAVEWEPLPSNRVLALPADARFLLRDDGSFASTANVVTMVTADPAAAANALPPVKKVKKIKKKPATATASAASTVEIAATSVQHEMTANQAVAAVESSSPSDGHAAPTTVAPTPPTKSATSASSSSSSTTTTTADDSRRQGGVLEALFQYKHTESIRCLALDQSRPWIACGLQTSRVQVYNYLTNDLDFSTPPFPSPITAVAFDNGSHLAIGLENGDVWLYDHIARQLLPTALKDKHTAAIRSILFHPTLPWVMTAGDDATIRVWDHKTSKDLFVLTGHRYSIRSLQLAAHSSDLLISSSLDRTVRVWDLGAVVAEPRPSGASIVCVSSISTASVTNAHNEGVAFAALPQPNLIVSASVDGELKAFQMSGLGADDKPRDLYVDVIDTATMRLPRRSDLLAQRQTPDPQRLRRRQRLGRRAAAAAAVADAAELDGGSGLYRGAGVLRVSPELFASLFVNDSVAYLSTVDVVQDEEELTPVLEPICFAVMGGSGGVLAPVDVETSSKTQAQAAPEAFELVALVRAHVSEPIFAVLHTDNTLRVMRVSPQFVQLLQVHRSTQLVGDKSTWLATISRSVSAQALAHAFAAHVDASGIAVTMDAANKSKFTARMRAAPARALDVCIGINDDGQRVMQAHWNDDRDAVLWRDMLRAFALLFLARNKLLVSRTRRVVDFAEQTRVQTQQQRQHLV